MIDEIIEGVLSFREVFFWLCGTVLCASIVLFFLCRKVDFRKNYRFTGFFFDMSMKESMVLSLAVIKLVATVYWSITRHQVALGEFIFIGVIVVVTHVLRPGLRFLLVDLSNYVLLMGALLLIYIMERYRVDVVQDKFMVAALILLQCFVCFFALHDFVTGIIRITDIDYRNKQKMRRSGHETQASKEEQVDMD